MARLGSLVLAAALPLACVDQNFIAPSAHEIFVQAVLDVSVTDQYVTVEALDGTIRDQKAITGAQVSIITPDSRILAADEVRDSTIVAIGAAAPRVTTVYRISLPKYGVSLIAGSTYRLRVVVPDGRQVNGTTTIPRFSASATTVAAEPFDVKRDTLSLAWPSVPGASGYEVTVSSARGVFTVFSDTTISLPGDARNADGHAFYAGLAHVVAVSAVDVNYYDYFRRSSDFFTAQGPISHLDGAIGVFGSIVPIARRSLSVH